MRRKKIANMSIDEVRRFYRALFDDMWEILNDRDHRVCFECGKKLVKGDTTLFCDHHGFLQLCNDCTFHKIAIRDTWKKVFRTPSNK